MTYPLNIVFPVRKLSKYQRVSHIVVSSIVSPLFTYYIYIYPTIPHDIPIYPLYFMLSHSPWVKTSPGRNTKSMRRSGYAWGRRAGRVAAAWPKSWASWLHQCPTTTAVSREFQWPFQVPIYWRYLPYTRPM